MGKIIYLIVSICVMVCLVAICVAIGFGAKSYNKDLQTKVMFQKSTIKSLEASIDKRDDLFRRIKMNSNGKGKISKIRGILEEQKTLREYERRGIKPTGNDTTSD